MDGARTRLNPLMIDSRQNDCANRSTTVPVRMCGAAEILEFDRLEGDGAKLSTSQWEFVDERAFVRHTYLYRVGCVRHQPAGTGRRCRQVESGRSSTSAHERSISFRPPRETGNIRRPPTQSENARARPAIGAVFGTTRLQKRVPRMKTKPSATAAKASKGARSSAKA